MVLTAVRSLKTPLPVTTKSSMVNPVATSLAVRRSVICASFEVDPLAIAVPLLLVAVITPVGAMVS